VKLCYRVFLKDRVDIQENTMLKAGFHSGMAALPVLKYNGTYTLVTKKLKCEKLSPVDGWTFYVGKVTRDRLRGFWLRFYRHGVMVNEWKTPDVPKCAWPENKDEVNEFETDKADAAKGAEEAAKAPNSEAPAKPAVPPPSKPEPPALKPEDPEEIPEELKIFDLTE